MESFSEDEKDLCQSTPSRKSKKFSKSKKSKTTEKSPKKCQVTKEKLIPTVCHICFMDFSTMRNLCEHSASVHKCRPKVNCICSFIIDNPDSYHRHKKRCCGALVAPFKCDLCSNSYASKNKIEKHMNAKHKSDSFKNKCKTCGKEFKYPTILRVHELTHLPDEVRKIHACTYCEKR